MNRKTIPLVLAGSAGAACLMWGNSAITTTTYQIPSPEVPTAFDGFRIAHISDLHNTTFGKDHRRLLDRLRETAPDIIAITGDMIDSRRTDMDCALDFAKRALEIAPIYYVMGNHETRIPSYPLFEAGLRDLGVHVLRNCSLPLERDGEVITIIGVEIPYIQDNFPQTLHNLLFSAKGYTVLLSHHPEVFPVYAEEEANLVLCGHAHGGQARIPGIGGVIAPHQGFFPKYHSGVYTQGRTRMVLSRGLGNSLFPLRFNNRPELVLVELKHV